jgi:uncharacterized repeat protein (TIGR03803 family)
MLLGALEVGMKNTFLCAALVVLLCGLAVGQVHETVLWTFGGPPNDGAEPLANLVSDASGNLYGTTYQGGNATAAVCSGTGCGTVFELSPGPHGEWTETILYDFCTAYSNGQCTDGAFPLAGLVLDQSGSLYGTTTAGGSEPCALQSTGCGIVFELSPPNSGGTWTESVMHDFCSDDVNLVCLDGAEPVGQLTFDAGGNLYGTASAGGSENVGVVFELSLNAGLWMQTVLYNFCSAGDGIICPDGEYPEAGITFDQSGNIYGTTEQGGGTKPNGGGTVYKLTPGSGGWTESVLLYSRPPYPGGRSPVGTVSFDELGNIYSTANSGGPAGWGSVFRLSPNGRASYFLLDGDDGFYPVAGVLVDSKRHAIYGTTQGSDQRGTVFQMKSLTQEEVLIGFCPQHPCTNGAQPSASLIEDKDGNLYGTTKYGGNESLCQGSGCGVVFEVTP